MKLAGRAIPRITVTAVGCTAMAAMLAPSVVLAAGPAVRTGSGTPAERAGTVTLYVSNNTADTVTPISTATNKPGKPIPVRGNPTAIAITPDGKTVYTANLNDKVTGGTGDTVTPISTATNKAGRPIKVGRGPLYIAITPAHPEAVPQEAPAGRDAVSGLPARRAPARPALGPRAGP